MPSYSSSFPAVTPQGSSTSQRASHHSQGSPPGAPSSLVPNSRPFYSFPPPAMHDDMHPPSFSLSGTIASSPMLQTRVSSQQPIPPAYLPPMGLSSAPEADSTAVYSLYSTTRMDQGPSPSSLDDDQSDVVDSELDLYSDSSSLSEAASDRSSSPIVIATIPSHVETKKKGERKPDKMHPCEVCHKEFPRPSALETHMNTHNKVFRTSRRYHAERQVEFTRGVAYHCSYPGCSKSFNVRSNARRHSQIHTDKDARANTSENVQIKFAETIIEAPHPERSLDLSSDSQSSFRIRWLDPNVTVRGKPNLSIAAPPRRKRNSVDGLQMPYPNDEPPMVLYAPYPIAGPSSQAGGAH
ncbi:hypothetical protein R3P38DRAFT_3195656 [Favolaschia claudopus]|uniref:C2H2-type domain-containing protein n=1 Tax=Favolaschia claudopus TaxID=2862362 RepID=A0AAW0B7W0_9AGAR